MAWPGKLPAPVADGDTLTYPEVLTGIDLVVQALPAGFSERLLVKQRPKDAVSVELTVVTTKASLEESEKTDGALHILTSSGVLVGSASLAIMWDARLDEVSGDPVAVAPVDVAVAAAPESVSLRQSALVGAGKSAKVSGTLVLSADAKMLADPATVFPVTIDPSFTKGASRTPGCSTTTTSTGRAPHRS